jgi:hypothetical protein
MAPRSRRDKDMSDNKANKPTIRVFEKGDSHLLGSLPHAKNTDLTCFVMEYRNITGKRVSK